jgi:hypothetical protein
MDIRHFIRAKLIHSAKRLYFSSSGPIGAQTRVVEAYPKGPRGRLVFFCITSQHSPHEMCSQVHLHLVAQDEEQLCIP